ncbi:unnamed protein product [Paramecium octaurelia]|uniref:COMM domain-containing protein n=1 Tax=Paramecium octaurelia TaxID=43137 RepID=A0A8S1TUX5_PAROT|nr:unnamed protein product [Paramecium octaurelia]
MNLPQVFNVFTDNNQFEKFIEDLVADCVHGIKLPYLSQFPEINHYNLIVEAQQFMQQFSEYLLEMNNQNREEVQRLLEKLKSQIDPEKHQIFTRIITENFKGMCKQALYTHIALSKYVLIDYNWNLNLTISSNKIAKSQIPTIIVELHLQTLDNIANKKKIRFEMTKEELEQFVGKLQKVMNQLQLQYK